MQSINRKNEHFKTVFSVFLSRFNTLGVRQTLEINAFAFHLAIPNSPKLSPQIDENKWKTVKEKKKKRETE